MEDRVKKLEDKVDGNGKEGLMIRMDRVEQTLDRLVKVMDRIVNLGWGLLALAAVWFLGRATYLIIQMESWLQ